jgi:hypothetical protein
MMAIESPEREALAAQRAELDTVLRSEQFMRAPTLAHLLTYLCGKLFAGEAHEVKEYSVGVEVFHRGEAFDQNTDSIVRVEANRLRKRLAAYYAGEGAPNPLHITIPLGQYVPQFLPRQVEAAMAVVAQSPVAQERVAPEPPVRRFQFSGKQAAWIMGGLALLVLCLSGAVVVAMRQMEKNHPAVSPTPFLSAPVESQLGPPVGEEIRILAGENRSFVDHAGKLWNADAWFDGGTAVKSEIQHIGRTLDPGFYRTSRQGNFRYAIPLKKGVYELRLHFAETVFGPESNETGGEGSRILMVRANGKTLLTHFDIVADAGASRTADVKVFTDISPGADGLLRLDFAGENGRQAILSAIEILPGFRGRIRPVRLLARQTPYYSNDSHWWSPDSYFEGGQMASYSAPVNGTDDPELYETERWGNFSYAIPVTPGKYSVTFYFAVRHGDWDQSSSPEGVRSDAVAHVFNVFCNGSAILRNFDVKKEAGQTDIVMRKATNLVPNSQGKLLLNFVPVDGYATVTGIEVLPQ